MKPIILFSFLFISHFLVAQSFLEAPGLPFEGVRDGSVNFADVDGDGDKDVLVTGENNYRTSIAKLYLNNGKGKYTEVINTPFQGVEAGSAAFADIDGDQDMDVLITGETNDYKFISELFTNDGAGNFSKVLDTPFLGVFSGDCAFGDVDKDGDEDVVIVGLMDNGSSSAKLYLNDGRGKFSEKGTVFTGVRDGSSVAFGDIDGDQDLDVLITGSRFFEKANLYKNDGKGIFSVVPNTPFDDLYNGTINFADIDGDTDLDVLITGVRINEGVGTKLYRNNGLGNFVEIQNIPFKNVELSSVAFGDIDADQDLDVLITGYQGRSRIELFKNDGKGNFNMVNGIPALEVYYTAVAFEDVDGDQDLDLFLTGYGGGNGLLAKLFLNSGKGNFSEESPIFENAARSSVALSDVDKDGDADVMISGLNNSDEPVTILYKNKGNGTFDKGNKFPFQGVENSDINFADIDGDGDPDVLLIGKKGTGRDETYIAALYKNNGKGIFSLVPNTPFEGAASGAVEFSDIDGDGDKDVLIAGEYRAFFGRSRLYRNDGKGNFTEIMDTPFANFFDVAIAFVDVDGDQDEDVLISGSSDGFFGESKLYLNDGKGNFTEKTNTPFDDLYGKAVEFGDFDGDQDQDLLITGIESIRPITKLFKNDGKGNFTAVLNTPFEAVDDGAVKFFDPDEDQDLDLILSGKNQQGQLVTRFYENDGQGKYQKLNDFLFPGLQYCDIAIGDLDGNNSPDIVLSGQLQSKAPATRMYFNEYMITSNENNEREITSQAMLYPNPNTTGEVYLNFFSESNKRIKIHLYQLDGRLLFQQNVQVFNGNNNLKFDWPLLTNGMYLVSIIDAHFSKTVKMIIQK